MRHFFITILITLLSACSTLNWISKDTDSSHSLVKNENIQPQPVVTNTHSQAAPAKESESTAHPTEPTTLQNKHKAPELTSSKKSVSKQIKSQKSVSTKTASTNVRSAKTPSTARKTLSNSPSNSSDRILDLLTKSPFLVNNPKQSKLPSLDVLQNKNEEKFNLAALIPPKKTNADFSDYGFITPTNDLEQRVNKELKAQRDKDAEATNNNLVDRLTLHFKLDLTLDNKRIQNQLNWYLRNPEYLDRTFKRSARYLYHVVEEAKKRKLPMELALLPFVESAYDPFAYSHGRASGLWQFIPGTGKIYGLHQSWWYDGRRDVLASTKAALEYLSYLNRIFDGNWLHALAAYNSGSGRVSKAIKRNKKKNKPTDFWSLKLPKETKAYVPKLLALAKIVNTPSAYGIDLPAIVDKPYFSVVKTTAQIDLAQAAALAKVDISEIYKLNPGFNQWASAPSGPHRLLVPIQQADFFRKQLLTLPPEKRLNWNRYSVKRGDSLIRISKKFNTTPKLIKQVNQLKSNMIKEKQKLLIPIASKGKSYYDLSRHNRLKSKQSTLKGAKNSSKIVYKVKSGDTIWDLARAHKVGVRSLAKWNGMAPRDPIRPGQELLIWSKKEGQIAEPATPALMQKREMIKRIGYRVRKGDSLARIADKFGVLIKDLVSWNKLNRKKYLQPGQKLTIYVDLTNS